VQALLSFEQAPPFSVPARFFLTAPLFGVAAGILLLLGGGEVLANRWGMPTLALTHMFTVGFLLQVMLGALFQVMPVAAGANIKRPLLVAGIVHTTTAVGAMALVAAFLSGKAMLFHAGGGLLGAGIGVFLIAAAAAFRGVPNSSPTIPALKLALGGLTLTAALGVALVYALIAGAAWPMRLLTDLHAGVGLFGWCAILLAGVAYVVVPMFQLTPGYTARFSKVFAPGAAALLLVWAALRLAGAETLAALFEGAIAVIFAGFAITTLNLQRRSKRSRPDTTNRYWRIGMIAAVLAACLSPLAQILGALGFVDSVAERASIVLAIVIVAGVFTSVISGMLYKILPFLSWQHLQNAAGLKGKVPHMGDYLKEPPMRRQYYAHAAAFACLAAAAVAPDAFARPAGLALIASSGLLFVNVLSVLRRYAAVRRGLPPAA
jgi:hypothetical protein